MNKPITYGKPVPKPISDKNIQARSKATTPTKVRELRGRLKYIICLDATTVRWKKGHLKAHKHEKRFSRESEPQHVRTGYKLLYAYSAICLGPDGKGHKFKTIPMHGTRDAQFIRSQVLAPLLKWKNEIYGEDTQVKWLMDNAREHMAKENLEYMQQKGIELLEHPAQSPDLNPIEYAWRCFKDNMGDRRPQTKTKAWEAIEEEWQEKVPLDYIQKIIKQLPRMYELVHKNPRSHAQG